MKPTSVNTYRATYDNHEPRRLYYPSRPGSETRHSVIPGLCEPSATTCSEAVGVTGSMAPSQMGMPALIAGRMIYQYLKQNADQYGGGRNS